MSCMPSNENGLEILKCAVLTTWSHTLGPQVVFTWTPNQESGPCPELGELTAHLLYSDILANSDKHPCCIRCKVLVLPKHEVVLQSRVFRALEWQEVECPLALTLVFSISQLEKVWSIYRVTEMTLTQMVKTLRKCKQPTVGAVLIQKQVENLCSLLTRLSGCQEKVPEEIKLSTCCIRWDSSFVKKCLVSHLQTSGRTVVIGTNTLHLKKLPEFLMHFLLEDEKACSVSSFPEERWKYTPGVFLQTLQKGSYESPEDLFRDLKISLRIPTVIDLDNLKVKQAKENHDDMSPGDPGLPRSKNQLKSVTETGTIIPTFMQQLPLTDPDELSHIYRRHLLVKGALCAKIIQDSCPKDSQLKKIIGVTEDADFKIVLGYMNKFWPRHS